MAWCHGLWTVPERLGEPAPGLTDLSALLFCCSAAEACLTSHGQRSLVEHSPWGHKESDVTEVI